MTDRHHSVGWGEAWMPPAGGDAKARTSQGKAHLKPPFEAHSSVELIHAPGAP